MAKPQTIYRCSKCDAQFPKWEGKCRECGGWGTLKEEIRMTKPRAMGKSANIVDFSTISTTTNVKRLPTGSEELDRVLGGGMVPGALVLLGGDPGVGKSTLLMQVASRINSAGNLSADAAKEGALAKEETSSTRKNLVLYVSGEESAEQVKQRLDRLQLSGDHLRFLGDPTVETIEEATEEIRPTLLIVDSLQTLRFANDEGALRPARLRQAIEQLMVLAKRTNVPIIVIGHVTKGGAVAGPKAVEHFVDIVLYFSAAGSTYRILSASKNRFGSVNEVGVWQMTGGGLVDVPNPAAAFLADREGRDLSVPGTTVTAITQGSRIFLLEVQALVSRSRFGYPQRRVAGFDNNRLQLLIAVLAKRLRFPLATYDVHVNVVGGLKATEPAADLAVAIAIASAFKGVAAPSDLLVFGEVDLQGDVRAVNDADRRVAEAARLGFSRIILPRQELIAEDVPKKISLHPVRSVNEALDIALSNQC